MTPVGSFSRVLASPAVSAHGACPRNRTAPADTIEDPYAAWIASRVGFPRLRSPTLLGAMSQPATPPASPTSNVRICVEASASALQVMQSLGLAQQMEKQLAWLKAISGNGMQTQSSLEKFARGCHDRNRRFDEPLTGARLAQLYDATCAGSTLFPVAPANQPLPEGYDDAQVDPTPLFSLTEAADAELHRRVAGSGDLRAWCIAANSDDTKKVACVGRLATTREALRTAVDALIASYDEGRMADRIDPPTPEDRRLNVATLCHELLWRLPFGHGTYPFVYLVLLPLLLAQNDLPIVEPLFGLLNGTAAELADALIPPVLPRRPMAVFDTE